MEEAHGGTDTEGRAKAVRLRLGLVPWWEGPWGLLAALAVGLLGSGVLLLRGRERTPAQG